MIMKRITKTWRSRWRLSRIAGIGLLMAMAYLAYSYLGGSYGFYNLWKLHRQRNALRAELTELQARQDSLSQEIRRLQNDTTYIEEVARRKYNMGKPGESIYIVAQKKP